MIQASEEMSKEIQKVMLKYWEEHRSLRGGHGSSGFRLPIFQQMYDDTGRLSKKSVFVDPAMA